MKLTKEQADVFKAVLMANTRDDLHFATELETDIIYRMAKYRNYSNAEDLRFFLKQNEEGNLYLDYFFKTSDYVSHFRIDHTGALIRLENMEGQWGWPVYEDLEAMKKEHTRMSANNDNTKIILQQKGLDGVDEQGKPLFEMSAKLVGTEWFTETRKLTRQ